MATSQESLAERCRKIEVLVLDVDGVLTDGAIIYGDSGVELKAFHVRDGSGLKIWSRMGKQAAIVTGRASKIVERRALELGIGLVFQSVEDKLEAFEQILSGARLRAEQACFVGDDLPDLPILVRCGLAVAVADACAEVRTAAHHVTRAPGGRGAVREVIEVILEVQGLWQGIVERFRAGES